MGALGGTARRLSAGLAALFLIALATALAPKDARAQTPTLTTTAGNGQVTLNWTYTGSGLTGWGYKINGGTYSWAGTPIAIPGSNDSTRSHTVTGLTNGTLYQFIVYAQTATNTAFRQSSEASATPQVPAPTLISDADRTIRTAETTTLVCYNLLSVSHGGVTYLETRQGKTAVTAHSVLSNASLGVEITQAPAGITKGRGVNLNPCVNLGKGTHTVTWSWRGQDGTATAGTTSTTVTITDPAPASKTVTISTASTTITEGDSGKKDVTINIKLGEGTPSRTGFDVEFVADSSTATDNTNVGTTSCSAPSSGADICYPGVFSNNAFANVEFGTNGSFKIGILGDTVDEGTGETVALRLVPNSLARSDGWTQNSNMLILTITDNDVTTTTMTPSAPTGLSAAAGNGQVVLTWSNPNNASITGYKLRHGKTSEKSSATLAAIPSSGAGTTTHTVTGLENGNEYSFRLLAVNSVGDGAETAWVTATPRTPTVAGVTISTAALTVEEGASGAYTVKLDKAPSADVTVTVRGASGDVTVEGSPLTFTTANWNMAQTVTARAAEDPDTAADPDVTLTHSASGGGYGSVTIASVVVSVTENDTPPATTPTPPAADGSVTVTPTALRVSEGSSAAYTVVLDAEPSGDVTVTVGGASGDVTVEPASLTFTTANWDTAQTVTVSAARDEDTTDDTATLTHSASGGGYGSVTIDSVAVTVTDTTLLPVLTLARDPAAVTEGQDIRLAVTADRALTGSLTVRLTLAARNASGFDAGDVPGGLGPRSFDAVFGSAARTTGVVTIPTAADADAEGAEAYRITLNDGPDYAVGSDATAAGVLRDRAPGTVSRANRVNAAVLPHVAAAAMSRTLGAVTDRIEAAASGRPGSSLRFGALPSSPVGYARSARPPRPEERGPTLSEILDGASFTLAAGAGEDEASTPPLAVWGRGEWLSLSGSEDGVSWDGGLWSAQLGADVRVRPDLLAGAALSHARGELDTQTTDGGVKGVHETTITSVHPYAGWLLPDGSTLWASLGYGTGEVRIAEEGAPSRTADLTQWSASAGGRSVLVEDAELIEGGMTRLAVKGEGALARLRTGSDDGLAGLTARTTRLRLLLEGSYEHALAGGATLTPALEAGVRHDGGDVAEGAGLEAGAGVTWQDPAAGLTAELRARLLAAHEADRDEWGVSALVRLDPGADGRGTFLAFGPAHGLTESGLGQWFDHGLPASASAAAPAEAESRLEAEVGHGFGLAGPGPLAVLTPWAGLSLAETGGRTLRLGARYRMGAGLSLGLEGAHRPGPAPEDSLMLRGALRW